MRYKSLFSDIDEDLINSVRWLDKHQITMIVQDNYQLLSSITYLAGRFGRISIIKALSTQKDFNINHAYLGALQVMNFCSMYGCYALGASIDESKKLYEVESYEHQSIIWFEDYRKDHNSKHLRRIYGELYTKFMCNSLPEIVEYIQHNQLIYLNKQDLAVIKPYFKEKYNYVKFLCHLTNDYSKNYFHWIFANLCGYHPHNNPLDKCMQLSNKISSMIGYDLSKRELNQHIDFYCLYNQEITKIFEFFKTSKHKETLDVGAFAQIACIINYNFKENFQNPKSLWYNLNDDIVFDIMHCMIISELQDIAIKIDLSSAVTLISNTWIKLLDIQNSRSTVCLQS